MKGSPTGPSGCHPRMERHVLQGGGRQWESFPGQAAVSGALTVATGRVSWLREWPQSCKVACAVSE